MRMPTTRDTAELLALKQRIEKLPVSDQLRLCAELLDLGKDDIVETLAGSVVDTLRARRLLGLHRG